VVTNYTNVVANRAEVLDVSIVVALTISPIVSNIAAHKVGLCATFLGNVGIAIAKIRASLISVIAIYTVVVEVDKVLTCALILCKSLGLGKSGVALLEGSTLCVGVSDNEFNEVCECVVKSVILGKFYYIT